MKKIAQIFILILSVTFIFSCKNEEDNTKEVDPVLQELGGDYYQNLIRTPVNQDGTIDTINVPKIKFDNYTHNFGTLGQQDKKEYTFEFTNIGKKNLSILNVKTSCGCTVANYNEDIIKPGERGQIKLNYDPIDRKGVQKKKVIVTTNTFPNTTELTIIADVIKQ